MEKFIAGKALRELGYESPAPVHVTPKITDIPEEDLGQVKKQKFDIVFYSGLPPKAGTLVLDVEYSVSQDADIDIVSVKKA